MKRNPDWQSQYASFLTRTRAQPFKWGSLDCCTFSASGIHSFTGVNIAEDFLPYEDEISAFLAIKKLTGGNGVGDALAYCSKKYGLKELPSVLFAQRGDLLLIHNAGRDIAGLVSMHGDAISITDSGIVHLPLKQATRAYRVG